MLNQNTLTGSPHATNTPFLITSQSVAEIDAVSQYVRQIVANSAIRIRREFTETSAEDSTMGEKRALDWVSFIAEFKNSPLLLSIQSIADVSLISDRIAKFGFINEVEAMLFDYILFTTGDIKGHITRNLALGLATMNTISVRGNAPGGLAMADYVKLLTSEPWLTPLYILRTVEFT